MPIDIQNLPGTGFNAEHRVFSSYFEDNHVIQQTCIVQPKNLLIDILRREFSKDLIYTYRTDEYGFPIVKDMTGQDIDDLDTTKIMISDIFRYDAKFYPLITIKNSGGSHKPLSFAQEQTTKYRTDIVESALYERRIVRTPTHRVYAGMWEMNFDITVYSESLTELEEIVEICSMIFTYSSFNELRANGLLINNVDLGSMSSEEYGTEYIYSQVISLKTLSEWRVEIPIENLIEKIVFYFDVKRTPILPNATPEDLQEQRYSDLLEIIQIEL